MHASECASLARLWSTNKTHYISVRYGESGRSNQPSLRRSRGKSVSPLSNRFRGGTVPAYAAETTAQTAGSIFIETSLHLSSSNDDVAAATAAADGPPPHCFSICTYIYCTTSQARRRVTRNARACSVRRIWSFCCPKCTCVRVFVCPHHLSASLAPIRSIGKGPRSTRLAEPRITRTHK